MPVQSRCFICLLEICGLHDVGDLEKRLIQWNFDFTFHKSTFFIDSTHIFISPTKPSIRSMLNLPCIYIIFLPSSLSAYSEWEWIWIGREERKWFLFIISCLFYFLCAICIMCCVQWSNWARLQTLVYSYSLALRFGPLSAADPCHCILHDVGCKKCTVS